LVVTDQIGVAPPQRVSLSLVIPTFRREDRLPKLFAALALQIADCAAPTEALLIDNSPEASARSAMAAAPPFVRYVHEPRPGVAHARNRGVAEASGSHVVFIDDDELPEPGWLAAFAAMANRGVDAAFGAIEPTFESTPSDALRSPLEQVFGRRVDLPGGSDISHLRAYLGTGNSLFAKGVLAALSPPFDPAFNGGGEDVWLFRHLVEDHRVSFHWCPDAMVHEIVPANRATFAYLRSRRFSGGQLRCLVESGAGGVRGTLQVAKWMLVGGAQVVVFGLGALVLRAVAPDRAERFALTASAGAGKLLWWRRKSGQ
jgi:succinoglycan biosynthesis protein ExoM